MNPDIYHSERDELEQHLGTNLHNYAPEAPDHLWAGIEARLPKRRRRRPVLWWLSGFGIVILMGGASYHYNDYIASGEEMALASTLTESPLGNQVNAAAATNPVLKTAMPDLPTDKSPAVRSGVTPEIVPRNTGFSQAKAQVPVKNSPSRLAKAIAYLQRKQQNVGNDLSAKMHFTGNILPKKIPFAFLMTQPKSAVPLLKDGGPVLPFFRSYPVHKDVDRWQVAAVAGPVWLWQVAGVAPPHHMPAMAFQENNDGPATGWQTGLSAQIFLTSHWQIGSGLRRRSTTQISSHSATLRLMDGVCLNPYDPGPKEYEFQYALHSGTDPTQVTVRIAQVDSVSTMPSNEPFTLDMRTTRQRTDWVLPLTAQRYFGRGRMQTLLQGGLTLNVSGKTDVRVEHFTEQCIDLCFASGHLPTLLVRERNKTSISWLLGTGLNYRLTRQMGLSFTPTLFGQKGQTGLALDAGFNFHF